MGVSGLPYFKACLLATILEDVIPQLRILDACNTELRFIKTISAMDVLLADKFGVESQKTQNDINDIDLKNIHCMKYKLDKLQADRDFILQVLTETYKNLCIERDFQSLTDSVTQIVQKDENLHSLAEVERTNRMLRRESHKQLRQQRNHIKSVCYESNSEIEFLRLHVEDAELNAGIRNRYIEGWQRSRTEQHLQTLYNKDEVPTQAIEEFKRKVEQEQRVHSDIELLTTMNINEVLAKVDESMVKYEKDIESIDLKIQIMRNYYETMQNKNQLLEETIKEHAEFMKNWITFKDDREAARKHCEIMNNSAIIVQAWWRGLLVRKQLGPYKTVKKKQTPSKPNDKSKKKK
ncbi:dynein regulatory complex protein 9-like isoform X2 [Pararge aegeria]|uniref:dynein regulatory complex protein 9-like isoform X2 n=1 Tax=Pararge aegeria TaxID=116150 RepID=UPI0019D06DA9|nr:dynein regulatory complex protein 9-like isoform X2 [Pararge aegeria]